MTSGGAYSERQGGGDASLQLAARALYRRCAVTNGWLRAPHYVDLRIGTAQRSSYLRGVRRMPRHRRQGE
jgi:hypothetical protein